MVPNQQQPNPNNITENLDSISNILEQSSDAINDLSIGSLYSSTLGNRRTRIGKFLNERSAILRGLVNEIDKPILKSFATEMLNTMAGWFNDPEVLCCLINAIWISYQTTINPNSQEKIELMIADTGFGKFLDTLIVFIDFMIAFISRDLRKIIIFIPDFIKEIFGALMGAILLLLQETLYTIRDSILQSIMDWIDDSVKGGSLWAGCLPFQQFLDIIKKYISDYGLFDEIMDKIRGFVAGERSSWKRQLDAALIAQNKNLEFLRWFRDLLVKLKQAVINFDLCVEYAYIPDNVYAGDPAESSNTNAADIILDPDSALVNPDAPAGQRVPLIVGDDNRTVTVGDTDSRLKDSDFGSTDPRNKLAQNGTYIARLSNDSVANFIKQNYGFSGDSIEQSMKKVSDGCAGFPGGQDLKNYLDRIRNKNIS